MVSYNNQSVIDTFLIVPTPVITDNNDIIIIGGVFGSLVFIILLLLIIVAFIFFVRYSLQSFLWYLLTCRKKKFYCTTGKYQVGVSLSQIQSIIIILHKANDYNL